MRNYSKPKLKKLGIRFILISYFVAMLSFIGFHVYYADKILPNIYVNDIAVGGLTFEEAQTLLAEKLKSPEEITLKIKDHEAKVSPTNIEFEFLPVATAKKAFYIGRTDSFSANIKSKALSILNTISLAPEYKYNSLSLRSFLNLAKIEALDEYLEPTYVYENDEVKILAGKSGETFDEAFIEKEIIKRLVFNLSPSLEAEVSMVNPTLSMQDLTNLKIRVDEILAKDYSLIFNDYSKHTQSELASQVSEKCMQKGLLVVHTGRESIKLGPPLIITDEAMMEAVQIIDESINEVILHD